MYLKRKDTVKQKRKTKSITVLIHKTLAHQDNYNKIKQKGGRGETWSRSPEEPALKWALLPYRDSADMSVTLEAQVCPQTHAILRASVKFCKGINDASCEQLHFITLP